MVGVIVTFQYDDDFDAARVTNVADQAHGSFAGMPGLRSKVFTLDHERRRALNFYVWESEGAASAFFTDALKERVTGLYGVPPSVEFVEIAALVDNAALLDGAGAVAG